MPCRGTSRPRIGFTGPGIPIETWRPPPSPRGHYPTMAAMMMMMMMLLLLLLLLLPIENCARPKFETRLGRLVEFPRVQRSSELETARKHSSPRWLLQVCSIPLLMLISMLESMFYLFIHPFRTYWCVFSFFKRWLILCHLLFAVHTTCSVVCSCSLLHSPVENSFGRPHLHILISRRDSVNIYAFSFSRNCLLISVTFLVSSFQRKRMQRNVWR